MKNKNQRIFLVLILLTFVCLDSEASEEALISFKMEYRTAYSTLFYSEYPKVKEFAEILKKHPKVKIRVLGHTDSVGSTEMNQVLSDARAENLKNILVKFGVNPDRIETKGFSENRPIYDNKTKFGRARNRRVMVLAEVQEPAKMSEFKEDADSSENFAVIDENGLDKNGDIPFEESETEKDSAAEKLSEQEEDSFDPETEPKSAPDQAELAEVLGTPTESESTKIKPEGEDGLFSKYWLGAGIGINYSNFSRESDNLAGISYDSRSEPIGYAELGFFLSDHLGLESSFRIIPGTIESSDDTADDLNYNWRLFNLDLLYRKKLAQSEYFFLKGSQLLWRFGLMYNSIPIFLPINNGSLVTPLFNEDFVLINAGLGYYTSLGPKFRFESVGKIIYSLSEAKGNSDIVLDYNYGVNAQVGFSYLLFDRVQLGLFWAGQWNVIKSLPAGSLSSSFERNSTIFFTNIDARIKITF